ncbi:MAG: sigma-E factor negative regulatory protein [Thioalkalivibrio sp.]|jgi:sigma-E factor negative regulatory protein RseA|nr:sigma-E factor negative regulatory protein [Thioalkalivibrio sp.]
MNEQVSKKERLSALVDGETDDFETRRLVDELVRSGEDRRRWERYHLIGDSLRGGMRRTAPPDFMDRIHGALADEPSLAVPQGAAHSRWLKPVAGTGIAAAVAVMTLAGLQMAGQGPEPAPVAGEAQTTPELAAGRNSDGLSAGSAEDSDELDPRFARYLENHAELAGPGSAALGRVRYSVSDE